ncbi:thermonuclease family protein [Thalassobacillus sp. CUG 92003]|uniref:thermonuclease family protein n=1 Tax=Thalassobacillus sp. CUG 92003 TaxID=2736641 RepID=UPI0015E6D724|nr:thermonuclease family protein [Thalassobacillus sp. CUG 92003]
MSVFLGIVVIIIALSLIISFPLVMLGISLFCWGIYELNKNLELKAKSKVPGIIISIGLALFIVGVIPTGSSDSASNNEEVDSSQQTSEETIEQVENEETSADTSEQKEEENDKSEEEAKDIEQTSSKEEEKEAKKEAEEKAKKEKEAEEKQQKKKTNATVTRVIDGDTLEVRMNGKTEDVRLLLVDTPETVHPNEPVQPFGPEATKFVKDTLSGKDVRVKIGKEKRDKYDRLLAYVFINGETIQEKLLRKGLARTAYLYNDLTMLDQFHKVQQSAINAGKGVWSIEGYAHKDHDHGYHYEEEKEEPEPEPEPKKKESSNSNLMFDPFGPDRNCGDFNGDHAAAQAFFEAAGGPENDPHDLNRDSDGIACDSLQ